MGIGVNENMIKTDDVLNTRLFEINTNLNSYDPTRLIAISEELEEIRKKIINISEYNPDILRELTATILAVSILLPVEEIMVYDFENIDKEIFDIRININSRSGKGKKQKYHGTINGNNVELTIGMFRVLQGIIEFFPNIYKISALDIKYFRLLEKLFPSQRLHWKRGKGCGVSEEEEISASQETKISSKGSRSRVISRIMIPSKITTTEKKNISLPLVFRLNNKDGDELEFILEAIEGHNNHIINCNGENITGSFMLEENDLKILSEIILGTCTSLSAHLRKKIEQNTPFSIQRNSDGKIEIFIKNVIKPPLERIVEIENGFDVLIGGMRVIIKKEEKGKKFAYVRRKSDSNLISSLTEKYFLILSELIFHLKTGKFIVLEGGSLDIGKLEGIFKDIGIQELFETKKEGNTTYYKLK